MSECMDKLISRYFIIEDRLIIKDLIGIGVGLGLGFLYTVTVLTASNRVVPIQEQVQQGYIAPSKVEIECKDLDGNGELETIIKIGDKPYLLREVDGKPVISAYDIKPIEVILKE